MTAATEGAGGQGDGGRGLLQPPDGEFDVAAGLFDGVVDEVWSHVIKGGDGLGAMVAGDAMLLQSVNNATYRCNIVAISLRFSS